MKRSQGGRAGSGAPVSETLQRFEAFKLRCDRNLRRICREAGGEIDLDDLRVEAWIAAADIANKRGMAFDFADATDQDLLLRDLYIAHVKRGDHKFRYARRFEQEVENEQGSMSLKDCFPAPPESDPFLALLRDEEISARRELVQASYSEAAAYAVVFSNFENDGHRLSAYLAVASTTLMHRVGNAIRFVQQQSSLFDRIEKIPEDFAPRQGWAFSRPVMCTVKFSQLALCF